MKIAISSGHGSKIAGAVGPSPWGLDEHAEAVRVVNGVAEILAVGGVEVETFEDTVSTTQEDNLDRICNWHNDIAFGGGDHDYDISVHFNAYEVTTTQPRGTEVWYYSQEELARKVSTAIADAGDFIDRGPKYSNSLRFLNSTREKSLLLEICFVDAKPDTDLFRLNFENIVLAISEALSGAAVLPPPIEPPSQSALFEATGKCSHFGGPSDTGVSATENLAFITDIMQMPMLFLPYQPEGTSGLARRLNPYTHYLACRWDYDVTSKEFLRSGAVALVRSLDTGIALAAFPADWGPHSDTNRIADLSPQLMIDLGISTDDLVEVIFPWTGDRNISRSWTRL